MTEEQTPQAAPQPAAAAPQQAPAKKSNVWLWIIGGCLTILVLIGIVIMALGWWTARKVKNAIKNNQPKLEQIQKDAEEWSKNAEEWQKQMEEAQKNMPNPEDFQMLDDSVDSE